MENNFKITVPKPCHEDWDKMSPEETGRFCSSCTKVVVDFTKMKSEKVQQYFIENQNKSICGRFNKTQIETFDIHIPHYVLKRKMPFHKAFLLALFIAMGSSLFSCKNHNDATLGEVVVEDTVKVTHTMGAPLPILDTTKVNHTIGITETEEGSSNKKHSTTKNISSKTKDTAKCDAVQDKFIHSVLTGMVVLDDSKRENTTSDTLVGKEIPSENKTK